MATEEASPYLNHLPKDAIQAILSWLPVKTLLTLRSICKTWKTIISDPSFARLHLRRQRSEALFLQVSPNPSGNYPTQIFSLVRLMKDGSFQLEADNLQGPRPSWRTTVLGSSEGVLLLNNQYSHNAFMLWNPSARAKAFFRFPYKFHPEKSIYGLVHVPATNDFKVVIAYDDYYTDYSLNNNSWTDKRDFLYVSWDFTPETGISADGMIYWLVNYVGIIYFDPRSNDFKMLEKPVSIFKNFSNESMYWLGCVRDCLCLLCYMAFDQTEIRIWKKEEGGNNNTWNELMVIEHEKPMSMLYRPVCLLENNKIVFQLYQIGWFLVYSPIDKTSEVINYGPQLSTLFPCREGLLLNVENLRRLKRKQPEPLELQK